MLLQVYLVSVPARALEPEADAARQAGDSQFGPDLHGRDSAGRDRDLQSSRLPQAGQAYLRIRVLLPNNDSIRSTATLAVLFCRSSAGLSSITSSEAMRPVSAIISMHSWASR